MHYGSKAYSKNGKPTILAIKNPSRSIGQQVGLSKTDADQLYRLYNCENTKNGWSDWSEWHPCFSDCKTQRQRFCYSSNQNDSCEGSSVQHRNCTAKECKGKKYLISRKSFIFYPHISLTTVTLFSTNSSFFS